MRSIKTSSTRSARDLGCRVSGWPLVVLSAACLLAAACAGGSGGTDPGPRVSQLEIDGFAGAGLSVAVGESRTLSIHALDGDGGEISDASLSAVSSNAGVASVSLASSSSAIRLATTAFLVRGEGTGSATITFRHAPSATTIDLPVTVTAPAPPPAPVIALVPSSVSLVVRGLDLNVLPQIVHISNAGGGILNWSASADSSWLEVTPLAGVGGGPLTLALDSSSLRLLCPGTFDPCTDPRRATVTVAAVGAESRTIEVTLAFAPAPPPPPADIVVLVGNGNRTFLPAQLTIRRGTRVIWRWSDSESHSVTRGFVLSGSASPFDSGIIQGVGHEFTHVFNDPAGTLVGFFCRPHSGPFGLSGHVGTIRITP